MWVVIDPEGAAITGETAEETLGKYNAEIEAYHRLEALSFYDLSNIESTVMKQILVPAE